MLEKCAGGDSLWGFVRGLLAVLRHTRVCFWRIYAGFTPILVGLYVLQHIKGVADVDICDIHVCKFGEFSLSLDTFG